MKNKNQKGITLIALVITIIVLIILAGISINLLFGQNGIINKAKSAGEVSEKATIDEKLKLAYSSVVIDKYIEGITDLSSRLQTELQKSFPGDNVGVTLNENGSYQVVIQGKGTYTIGEGGKVEEVRLAGFYKNNGEYVSWQELIDRNLILVEGTILKYDEDNIGNGVTILDAKDWAGTLVIDDSITEIEYAALTFLIGIKKVIIPATTIVIDNSFIETWGYYVGDEELFANIETIEVDPANPNYTSVNGILFSKDMKTLCRAPQALSGVYEVPNTVETIDENAFDETHITGIIIPNSVETINACAFASCNNLVEINIPNSVTNIGYYKDSNHHSVITWGCKNLININMESGSSVYKSVDGVLYSLDGTILYEFPMGRTGEYVIPDGVTTIKAHAFNKALIENIVFASSVRNIELYACAAENFDHVVLPDNIDIIGDHAFGILLNGIRFGCEDVTYKGTTYTSKSALTSALRNNGVEVINYAFYFSKLGD